MDYDELYFRVSYTIYRLFIHVLYVYCVISADNIYSIHIYGYK